MNDRNENIGRNRVPLSPPRLSWDWRIDYRRAVVSFPLPLPAFRGTDCRTSPVHYGPLSTYMSDAAIILCPRKSNRKGKTPHSGHSAAMMVRLRTLLPAENARL